MKSKRHKCGATQQFISYELNSGFSHVLLVCVCSMLPTCVWVLISGQMLLLQQQLIQPWLNHNLLFISNKAVINKKERKKIRWVRNALSFLQNGMLLLIMKPTEVKRQRPSKKTRRRRCFCMFFYFRIILQRVAVFLRDRRIPFVFWIWRQLNVGTGIKMPEVFTM